MNNNVLLKKASIKTHNNWSVVENNIKNKLISKKKIIFMTFCEMYFYKGGKPLKEDWIGIIHDPEDTNVYYKGRSIINNKNFKKSIPYCKGLFCMSHSLKDWIIKKTNLPAHTINILHHPISDKNLKEFQIEEYKKNKSIIQIGNWLRKTYSIFKINTYINKEILPWNRRTKEELNYFLKKDKVKLTQSENKSVTKVSHVSDDDYNKIFNNKIVFLDLYSSTANNVIMECMKSNNPIIVNRHKSVEEYLGKEYPLFYDKLADVPLFLKNDKLILKAFNYLKNMDKSKFTIQVMADNINTFLYDTYKEKYLLVKPCYKSGNVGDAALIKSISNLFNPNEICIPQTINELDELNINNFKSLIYLGNDCVAYYPDNIPIKKINDFLNVNKKVHIINTSWGNNPLNPDIIKSIANNPNFQIYMIDKYSHELIQKDITFHNTPILSADIAFLLNKNISKKVNKLEEWFNKNNKLIIGINIYDVFKEHNIEVKNKIRKFIVDNKNKYRYLFIPHDSRHKEYEYLQDFCKSCNNIDGYTTNYLDPEYEKHITSKLYFIITVRIHLSILTIPNNIPAIAIAYNGLKTKGSFEHWGLDDLVIEPKNINTINNKIKYIEENYHKIQDTIDKNKEKVKSLAMKTYDNITL